MNSIFNFSELEKHLDFNNPTFPNSIIYGEFLIYSGEIIIRYIDRNLSYLFLSISLFQRSRKFLKKHTYFYGESLLNECYGMFSLAKKGIDSKKNFKKSIKLAEKARYEGLKEDIYISRSLFNEGVSRVELAMIGEKPIKHLNKAIELFQKARLKGFKPNTEIYANALWYEGTSLDALARIGINPQENLNNAIDLFKKSRLEGLKENTHNYGLSLMNEGNVMRTFALFGIKPVNNLHKAINLYEKARKKGLIRNTHQYGLNLVNEGLVRSFLAKLNINVIENLNEAVNLFEKSRSSIRSIFEYGKILTNEANARSYLADIGIDTQFNIKESLKLYEEAEEYLIENKLNYAKNLNNQGTTKIEIATHGINPINNLNDAITLFGKSKSLFEKNTSDYIGTLINEASARSKLLNMHIDTEKNQNKVENLYLEARNFYIKSNDKLNLIRVNFYLGKIKYSKNEFLNAYEYLKESIYLIETIRSSIEIPEMRKAYFESVVGVYNKIIMTAIALGKYEEAFNYLESSKGKMFLEFLANEKKKIKGDDKLIGKYVHILKEIREKESMILTKKLDIKAEEELRNSIHELKKTYNKILMEIKLSDPEYYSIETVKTISLDKLSNILEKKTLIEYFVGEKLLIFILNEDKLIVEESKVTEREISKKTEQFRKIIDILEKEEDPDRINKKIEDAENVLNWFYSVLIEPIKEHLSSDLVIIPHKNLHLIPFKALKGSKYLLEDHKISFAQSASSLQFLRSSTQDKSLVIGNPTCDLDYAESEAIEIAKTLKADLILRDDAKKEKIIEQIKNKDIIHFACHGCFDKYYPLFSGIKLNDGILNAIDFMNIELNSNLVVLSACDTAIGTITHGDEIEGLIRSIHYGNCRFIIASLWKVMEGSTKELFLNFYNENGDMVDNIRQAELKLLKKGYNFYQWAPFQIYGI